MKNKYLLILLAFVLAACGTSSKKKQQSEEAVVTVSILPQRTFVEKIAGKDFRVQVLIPPGSSPASYSLRPSQLEDLTRSSIWFRIGYIGFEHSWSDKIAQTNPTMKVVNLSEGLDLIAESKVEHGDHVHVDGVNPHIWLSPVLVKRMSKRICDELSALKPDRAEIYRANYQKFANECDSLHQELSHLLQPYKGKKFIVFHPSLSYYARDYGLEQFSLEVGGKEPTPQQLREIVDMAKRENIHTIYIQSEFDRTHAKVFADEINGHIEEVWPLNPDWANNLRKITQVLIANFE